MTLEIVFDKASECVVRGQGGAAMHFLFDTGVDAPPHLFKRYISLLAGLGGGESGIEP